MTLKEYYENHREYYIEKCISCGNTVYSDESFDSLPVCDSCREKGFEYTEDFEDELEIILHF